MQDPKILVSQEFVKFIAEIDEFKGKWEALKNMPPERMHWLRKVATIESIVSSMRIEGVKLSNTQVQSATRFGADFGYKQGHLRTGTSLINALKQDRLATFETSEKRSYTQWDANIGYTQKYGETYLTYFAVAKNLLDQDIRLSTSLLKDASPLPGRTLMDGVRTLL